MASLTESKAAAPGASVAVVVVKYSVLCFGRWNIENNEIRRTNHSCRYHQHNTQLKLC